jgi:hypothetical protein
MPHLAALPFQLRFRWGGVVLRKRRPGMVRAGARELCARRAVARDGRRSILVQGARTSDAFVAPKCSSGVKEVDRQRKWLMVSPMQLALEIRNKKCH